MPDITVITTPESAMIPAGDVTAPDWAALTAQVDRVDARAVSWADYTPDSAGLVAAAAAAGPGGTIFAPRRDVAGADYTLDAQVVLTDQHVVSNGAEIEAGSDLGAGVAALVLDGTDLFPNLRCEGFALYGPTYGARTLGVSPCAMDGIEVRGQAKVHFGHVWVRFFHSGIVYNNVVGHVYHTAVFVDNNYYGIYLKSSGYDYYFQNCQLNGNVFANVAGAAGQGWESVAFVNTHIGFAPYGLYQESTPATTGIKPFLSDALFDHARFEALGNGAILSEAPNDASNRNITRSLRIIDPGFSWNDTYKIAARPRDYAIDIPYTEGAIEIEGGLYPFAAGALGRIRIKQANHAYLRLRYADAAASHVTRDAGTGPVLAVVVPLDGIMTVADAGASRIARLTGSAGSYVDFSGDNTRRIGTDNTNMFLDFAQSVTWRHSAASYGTVARMHGQGLVVNKLFLASAGADGGPTLSWGTGSPEGVRSEPVGSIYVNLSGGATTTLYVKTGGGTGNTGWSGK